MQLAGSIIAIFTWSIFRLSSIILLVLWAFNPLGFQTSFRGIYLAKHLAYGEGCVSSHSQNLSAQTEMEIFSDHEGRDQLIRALYSAALYDTISST